MGLIPSSFTELLAINPQARNQLINDYMRPSHDIDTIATFLEAAPASRIVAQVPNLRDS